MRKFAFLILLLPGLGFADAGETMARMVATVNSGVAIAVEGANLIIRSGGSEEKVDAVAAAKGRELIAEGKALVVEAASGETMMKLHSGSLSDGEMSEMMRLHRIEGAALKFIEALESL